MADFRKWILALSVLALVFTGVASAQVNATPLTCQAGTANPPQLRTEGYTELVGDIVITCTGGSTPALGTLIPQANVVVNMQGTVTSRLIGAALANGNPSEALLLIDEPGSAETGVGPAETQFLCTTPATGCQAFVGTVTNAGGGPVTAAVTAAGGTTPAQNVYEGVVNGSEITFFGVPILAPVTSGASRVYRITNVRVNANGITGGGAGFQSVLGQIAFSPNNVNLTQPTATVGYIQSSLSASFRNAANSAAVTTVNEYQCQPVTNGLVAVLRFSELFGTAFKTRVNGATPAIPQGQYPGTVNPAVIQNIPGAIYNSESGFISAFNGVGLTGTSGGNTFTAGLADYGTRLKAVFSNIPTGVSVYVSSINLTTGGTNNTATPAGTGIVPAGGGYGTTPNDSPELALLVSSEAGIDTTTIPAQTGLAYTNNEWLLPVSSAGGSEAIWEVVQALPNSNENFDFGVYVTFPSTVVPTTGISATLSYAPTPTVPFTAVQAGQASASLTIPRFAISTTSSATPFLNVSLCTSALLFPYVTTAFLVPGQSGFDTGLAISNTTMDPFGTPNQAGLCTLYWYGGTPGATTAGTNPAPTTLGAGGIGSNVPIISGTTALTLASQSVPADFSGYMIALCNFQYAHGYASVTDVGVRNIMASYLALVITDRTYGGCFGSITTPGSCAGVENLNN